MTRGARGGFASLAMTPDVGALREVPVRRYNPNVQIRLGRHSLVLLLPFFVSFCSAPPRGIVILCAGDSITAAAYPHFLQKLFNREGIRARVLNFGRSGFSSGEYRRFLERGGDGLTGERPDFVLVELGTNDVRIDGDHAATLEFAANMRVVLDILGKLRDRSGRPARVMLATIPPVPEGTPPPFAPESSRRVEADINPAIRSLAAGAGLPVIDIHAVFAGRPDLLPGIHPSRDGYRRMAEAWLAVLKPIVRG